MKKDIGHTDWLCFGAVSSLDLLARQRPPWVTARLLERLQADLIALCQRVRRPSRGLVRHDCAFGQSKLSSAPVDADAAAQFLGAGSQRFRRSLEARVRTRHGLSALGDICTAE
jgi:hypothetical protein